MPKPLRERGAAARRFLIVAAVATGLVVATLLWSSTECPSAELRFGAHPNIMCLELPITGARADATLARWRAGDGAIARAARRDTAADYGFLLFYGAALAITGWQARERSVPGAPARRRSLIVAPLGAALADAIENQGIFRMLAGTGPTSDALALLTSAFAALKLVLLIVWVRAALGLVPDLPSAGH